MKLLKADWVGGGGVNPAPLSVIGCTARHGSALDTAWLVNSRSDSLWYQSYLEINPIYEEGPPTTVVVTRDYFLLWTFVQHTWLRIWKCLQLGGGLGKADILKGGLC